MQTTDPASLDRLNDFVFPDPVGMFPLAPVWKFAIALALLWLAMGLWTCVRRYRRNAYRRAAIAELSLIEATGDVTRLNELLKRTAMTAYGRDAAASLSGDRWLAFLINPTCSLALPGNTLPPSLPPRTRGPAGGSLQDSAFPGGSLQDSAFPGGSLGTSNQLKPPPNLLTTNNKLTTTESSSLITYVRYWITHHPPGPHSC